MRRTGLPEIPPVTREVAMNVGSALRSPFARVCSALASTLVLVGTLGFPGCPDSNFRPGTSSNPKALAMANLWPNADGS